MQSVLASTLQEIRMAQKSKPARRTASRLRAVSDELGVTMPKPVRRSSAGKKQAPRAKPRKVR
jgi:hypothetical protein